MKRGSLSNRTPQDVEISSSIELEYKMCKIEMMKKPQMRHIFHIMELDMRLLHLINQNVGMLKIESDQNQLKQLVELIKMNVNLLIHEHDLLQSISELDLEELDGLLAASHTTGQASTQHGDPLKNIKDIYKKLEKAKANAGQVESGENLIEDIKKSLQLAPSGSSINPSRLNNDVAEHIVNLLPVELRPASAKSNRNLVKQNLDEMNNILSLLKQNSSKYNSNQIKLTDNLIKVTSDLIALISTVDCRPPTNRDVSNWKAHAARIIKLCNPKVEYYIDKMDSFKDICNQVATMYKHSYHQKISTKEIGYTWCRSFHNDIFNGNCEGVVKFLKEHPLAWTTKITVDGNTALHIAVKARRLKMVMTLLAKLNEEKKLRETLEKQNKEGKTALYIAASGGFPTIAEELVNANNDTLLIECENATIPSLPLFVAAKYDNKEVVRYLYNEMKRYERENEHHQKPEFFPQKNENVQNAGVWDRQWATFLADLIHNDDYDMAYIVNGDYPSLALLRYTNVKTPLLALAQRPSLGANKTIGDKASKFQLIPFTGGNKVDHNSISKASKLLERIISNIDLQSHKSILRNALFKAAEVGSVEFVTTIINYLPPAVSWLNGEHQSIFHVAIKHRQEEVFNLIYGLGPIKNDLAGSADKVNNWMLHLTGKLAPPHRLNRVPSAALQLQRELKWFEAVKAIVPNSSTNVENLGKKTPYELFVSEHKNLMKDGEKWIKDTASSCSIVAALITTVVFAAAFTIPGDTNKKDTCFLIFVISVGVALFSSCTSVLIFLAILTSRFALEDFLISLPNRLIKGIVFLFISMITMMSAFGVTIYIIIRDGCVWCYFPIIVAGLVPVFTFFWMMSTLLIDLWQATWNSIFNKTATHLYY